MAKFDKSWRDYEPPTPEERRRRDRSENAQRGPAAAGDPAGGEQHRARVGSQSPPARCARRGAGQQRYRGNKVCYVDPGTRAIYTPELAEGILKARARTFSNDPPLERFQSEKEAKRYVYLLNEQDADRIHGLRRQVRYPLIVRRPDGIDETIAHYTDDFEYFEGPAPQGVADYAPGRLGEPGSVVRFRAGARRVVEDTKGFKTEMYRRNKKHFEAQYGLKIKET